MPDRGDSLLAGVLVVLAGLLAANALLGPLVAGVVTYPFSETLVAQTVGLEAVTLFVVTPWCLVAAWLVRRGHRAGPLIAIPPAGYAAYMFVQYVVGPQYTAYRRVVVLHLLILILSEVALVRAWSAASANERVLPAFSRRRRRLAAGALVLFAAFTLLQYLTAFRGFVTGAALPPESAADPSMYWSIVLLDLGVVVPATLATIAGLLRGAAWAERAAYGVVGWFTLVPVSVTAMGLAMLAADDANASLPQVTVLGSAAVAFTLIAVWLYRPLLSRDARVRGGRDAATGIR